MGGRGVETMHVDISKDERWMSLQYCQRVAPPQTKQKTKTKQKEAGFNQVYCMFCHMFVGYLRYKFENGRLYKSI